MKAKFLNLGLIFSSFLGYLEWGTNHSSFLIVMEIELFSKLFHDPMSVLHPFVIIPFGGQMLLLITVFQKEPSRMLSLSGLTALSILLLFIFLIGAFSLNIRIFASALPFVIIGIISVLYHLKKPDLTS